MESKNLGFGWMVVNAKASRSGTEARSGLTTKTPRREDKKAGIFYRREREVGPATRRPFRAVPQPEEAGHGWE